MDWLAGSNANGSEPIPALTVLPAFVLPKWIAIFGPMLLFVLWNPGLVRRSEKIPKRSQALLAVLTVSEASGLLVAGRGDCRMKESNSLMSFAL